MALTKTEIISTALRILDAYGLNDLTMRRLADSLDVKASALYWHVANKQSLLAELVDKILAGLEPPELDATADGDPWRPSLRGWATELRARLLDHRDSADLVASMRAIGLAGTELSRAPAAVLTAMGMADQEATTASQTLIYFILGHVDEEQQRAQLGALAGEASTTPVMDGTASFAAGLNLIFDGMAAALPHDG